MPLFGRMCCSSGVSKLIVFNSCSFITLKIKDLFHRRLLQPAQTKDIQHPPSSSRVPELRNVVIQLYNSPSATYKVLLGSLGFSNQEFHMLMHKSVCVCVREVIFNCFYSKETHEHHKLVSETI